jgi:mycothiol synthase
VSARRFSSSTSEFASLGVKQIEAIRQACLRGDGVDPVDEAIGLRLRNHGLGPADHLWVSGADGFALAFTDTSRLAENHPPTRVNLTLAVTPESRGRGVGTSLLNESMDAAPYTQTEWSAWSHGDHPAAARLAAHAGWERVRSLWLMRISTAEWASRQAQPARPAPPAVGARPTPSGIAIRPYQPGDANALIAVNAAAFADHPEQGAMDAANLAERMAEPWFDPAGLFVAVDEGDTLVGFHWTKLHPSGSATDPTASHHAEPPLGEVYVIGVAPQAHGRGLGRLLMQVGLQHLSDRGARQIILYVEGDNQPALALYRSLGFTHDPRDTHVRYHRHRAGHRSGDRSSPRQEAAE